MATPRPGEKRAAYLSRCMACSTHRGLSPTEKAERCYGLWQDRSTRKTADGEGAAPAKKPLTPGQLRRLGQQFLQSLLSEWNGAQQAQPAARVAGETEKCGGPGSGQPGPCPREGGPDRSAADKPSASPTPAAPDAAGGQRARSMATRLARGISRLPGKVWHKAKSQVAAKYTRLESRYGPGMARAIIGAGLAGTLTPIPGGGIVAAAPLIAAGELYLRLGRKKAPKEKSLAEQSPLERAAFQYDGAGRGEKAGADLTRKHIVKLSSGKYRLLSSKKGPDGKRRNLGTFDSYAAAAKHEGQVEYFKGHGKSLASRKIASQGGSCKCGPTCGCSDSHGDTQKCRIGTPKPGPCPEGGGSDESTESARPADQSQAPEKASLLPKKFGKSKAPVSVATVSYTGKSLSKKEIHQEVQSLLESCFPAGTRVEDMASLVGAPDDAEVKVSVADMKGGRVLHVAISHADYDATRFIGMDKKGKTYIKNDEFWVKPGKQGAGLGAEVFGKQVENALESGVAYIACHAAKKNPKKPARPHNGYYTWPRFGYDQSLDDFDEFDAAEFRLKKKIRQTFPKAKSILDVMATPEGRDWWKTNGDDLHDCKFDLSEGSRSLDVFSAYLRERAERGGKPTSEKALASMTRRTQQEQGQPVPEPKRDAQGRLGHVEEIVLSKGDEQALERAWQRISKQGFQQEPDRKATAKPQGGVRKSLLRLPATPRLLAPESRRIVLTYKASRGNVGLVHEGKVETNDDEMSASGILATSARDLQGDIIECGGVDFRIHRENPVALWDHGRQHDEPVGKTESPDGEYLVEYHPDADIITQKTYFAPDPFSRQIYALVRGRFVRGNSIAVKDLLVEELDPDPDAGHFSRRDRDGRRMPFKHILKSLMAEATWCALPANPEAVFSLLGRDRINTGGANDVQLDPIVRKSFEPFLPPPVVWSNGVTLKSLSASLAHETPRRRWETVVAAVRGSTRRGR